MNEKSQINNLILRNLKRTNPQLMKGNNKVRTETNGIENGKIVEKTNRIKNCIFKKIKMGQPLVT
jgi:hypothetical protein